MYRYLKISIFLLIFINLIPGGIVRESVNVDHFYSSIHMFEYAFSNRFQFGIDIIDNVGPYGYLHYPYIYTGGAYWTKTLWFTVICFVYSCYTTVVAAQLRTAMERGLFVFIALYFPLQINFPWFSFEILPRLATFFAALYLLKIPREKSNSRDIIHIILNGLFFAFLTLEKASNVYFLALVISALAASWIVRGKWQSALFLVVVYLTGIVIFWLGAGQHLSALFTYLQSMSHFINAYSETLSTDTSDEIFRYGVFYCFATATLIIARLGIAIGKTRQYKDGLQEFIGSILVAALIFLSWKHGVLRNTQSFGTFMYTVPVMFAYLCFHPILGSRTPNAAKKDRYLRDDSYTKASLLSRCGIFLILLCSVNGKLIDNIHNTPDLNFFTKIHTELHSRYLMIVNYNPLQIKKELDSQIETLRTNNELPTPIKLAMKNKRVDEFGSVPEIIFLNKLDYRPRPAPINFIVGNDELNKKNREYYGDTDSAPDFIFLEDYGQRHVDSSAYLSLLFNYQAVSTFKKWLILEKRTDVWTQLSLNTHKKNATRFGNWISVDGTPTSFYWLEVDVSPSVLGQVKRFLYKPEYVNLHVLMEDDSIKNITISIAQLRAGFLLNPWILTRSDIAKTGKYKKPWANVKAFQITLKTPESAQLFEPEIIFKLSKVTSHSSTDDRHTSTTKSETSMAALNLFDQDFGICSSKFPVNLFTEELREDITVSGLSGVESNETGKWRWALGPATSIRFYVDSNLPISKIPCLLKMRFKQGFDSPKQEIIVRLNGKKISYFNAQDIDKLGYVDAEINLNTTHGLNELDFVYQDWNHKTRDYGSDPRNLAIVFEKLLIGKR